MTKGKILYISYDGMTDPLGQSQVLPYLQGLAKLGYEIFLISCEKKQRIGSRPSIEKLCSESGIQWHPISYTKTPPVISTIKDIVSIRTLAERLHAKHNFQIIHCRSYISSLIGLYFKKKHRTKFLFDMRGFWADERVEGGIWKINNPVYKIIYRYFKRKEKEFILNADYTISLTEKAREIIETTISKRKINIEVIPCCADTDHFSPHNVNKEKRILLQKKSGIATQDKILGYVGSLGTWYLMKEMLIFFKMLQKESPQYKFLILTLDNPEIVYALADEAGINKNSIIVTSSGRSDLPEYYSLMSASIFFIKASYSKQASSPTKQGELMAMGIPVITNDGIGDSTSIIKKYRSGEIVNFNNPESMLKAIKQLKWSDKLTTEKLREGALDFFSLKTGIKKYEKVYSNLLGL